MLLKGKDIITYLSVKYDGDWNSIYQAIKNKEMVDEQTVLQTINEITVSYTTIIDEDYPESLKKIYKPPFVLYYKGNLKLLDKQPILSISGSYKLSEYTHNKLDEILKQFRKNSVTIATSSKNNNYNEIIERYYSKKMIVVHDSGINKYMNTDDYGLTFSEYPERTGSNPQHINWANRLLAGISNALFVPEVLKKEPALITVGYGVYLNKPVGVLSQQASSKDATTELIKDGAIVVTTASELLKLIQLPNTTNESKNLPDHNSVEA